MKEVIMQVPSFSADYPKAPIYVADLVRCKECRHSFINENHPQKSRICGLTKMCGTTKDDWFCADGEREGE